MKHLLPYSFFLFGALLISSCSEVPSDNEGARTTIVEGALIGNGEGEVQLLDRKGCFTYADSIVAKDSLEKGRFRVRFQKERSGYLRFETPSEGIMLYLHPGDSLFVNRDAHGNYRFRGQGKYPNRYIRMRKAFKDSLGRVQDTIFQARKADFLKGLKERRNAMHSFRKAYFRKHKGRLGDRFRKLERSRDKVDFALMRFSYPDIYSYEHPNDSIELSPAYWNFLDSMDMNDTLLLQVPEYLSFAYDVANRYTLENRGHQKNMTYREMLFQTILEEFQGKVKDALLTYFVLEQLRYGEKKIRGSLMERYRQHVKHPYMERFVEQQLKEKEAKPSL